MKTISDAGKFVFSRLETLGNRIFTPAYNPLYYLGGISFHMLYLLFITGSALLFFYTISVTEAYQSIKYITKDQWYFGGIMRSLHRYATDGLMLVIGLHLLREFSYDKYRFYRWVAWASGVVLLFAIWVSALIGCLMVWDTKAQVIALYASKLMDYIIFLNEPMSVSFLAPSSVPNIFFFVILFFHISVPTFLLFIAWLHYARISKPKINPPRIITVGIFMVFMGLAILSPATLDPPANLTKMPASIQMDWFIMPFFPLLAKNDAQTVWVMIGGIFLFLFILPWLPGGTRLPKAEVIRDDCTGCMLCRDDCPYEAITLRHRTDGPFEMEAVIMEARCAGCGICLGSCDFNAVRISSRNSSDLNTEIAKALASVKSIKDVPTVMAFVCDEGPNLKEPPVQAGSSLTGHPSVRIMNIPCVGMVNSGMIKQAFESGAAGVFVAGCGKNECLYRYGNTWLDKRLEGSRPPKLKIHIEPGRIRTYFAQNISGEDFTREISIFLEELKGKEAPKVRIRASRPVAAMGAVILMLPAFLIWSISSVPTSLFEHERAMLKVGFKHKTPRAHACTDEEILEYQRKKVIWLPGTRGANQHMKFNPNREPYCGKRERNHAYVEIWIDREKRSSQTLKPSGIYTDGSIFLFHSFMVDAGEHRIEIRMKDTNGKDGYDYLYDAKLGFSKGDVIAITFDRDNKQFVRKL